MAQNMDTDIKMNDSQRKTGLSLFLVTGQLNLTEKKEIVENEMFGLKMTLHTVFTFFTYMNHTSNPQ